MTSSFQDTNLVRRHLLIIGVGQYKPKWGSIKDGVEAEVKKARALFLDLLKFESSTFKTVSDTTQEGIKKQVSEWCKRFSQNSNDLLVVYWTGHGLVDRGIFCLVTSDVEQGEEGTALTLDALIRCMKTEDHQVLLIVDTCQSGAGTSDALEMDNRLREAWGGRAREKGLHIISTARSIEFARTKAFIEGLDEVIRSGGASTSDEEFLRPDKLIGQVNAALTSALDDENQQHARLNLGSEGLFQFFPNPWWEPRLSIGLSAHEAKRVLHHIQNRALASHWRPRARGVALDSEVGWFFTGRSKAANELVSWIGAAPGQAGLVITGMPGTGKSALLARMVTLADQVNREMAQQAGVLDGVLPDELPSIGSLKAAVHARAKTSNEIALELAAALGADLRSGETDPETLAIRAASGQTDRTILLIDALDEAQNPEQAASFLRAIVDKGKEARIIVGLRSGEYSSNRLVDRLGKRFTTLDLGSEDYLDPADVARYVERYLLQTKSSPYAKEDQAGYAAEVAKAVATRAGRSFLVASTTARALASHPEVLSRTELVDLPCQAGEAFEFDFKVLSQSEREEAILIFGVLAFSQGRGLPHVLWTAFASAIGSREFSSRDLDRWLDRAGYYVTREEELGMAVVRLYHEEFARFLRGKVAVVATEVVDHQGALVETMEALVPRDQVSGALDWTEALPYIKSYLPRHLKAAGRREPLFKLVLDQRWISARKERGDPTLLLEDLDLAIQMARDETPPNIEIIARCCLAYSRYVTTAPPLILDVLAAAGQLGRAALIADNIRFPLDRCQAFCYLAERNAPINPERARQQLLEARRSARAVVGSYGAMTSYWIVHAALTLAEPETAQQVANAELCRTQLMVQKSLGERPAGAEWWKDEPVLRETMIVPEDYLGVIEVPERRLHDSGSWMELAHTLFWTAMALREARDEVGLDTTVKIFNTMLSSGNGSLGYGANLELQFAGVARHTSFLDSYLPWKQEGEPYRFGGMFGGNLALALATAGRSDDVKRLLEETRSDWQGSGSYLFDSAKRLGWALALCGRFEESFDHIRSIQHPEERFRALFRVTEVLRSQKRKADLSVAADLAEEFLAEEEQVRQRILRASSEASHVASDSEHWMRFSVNDFWRLRSWASWIFSVAGRIERALELAELVCAEEITPTENTSLAKPTRITELRKRHVTTATVPDSDAQVLAMVFARLASEDIDGALGLVDSLLSEYSRVTALTHIARDPRSKHEALNILIRAIWHARHGGEGLVKHVLQAMSELGRTDQGQSLDVICESVLSSKNEGEVV